MPSRRQVLTTVGALSAGSAAGCLGERETAGAAVDGDGTTDWPMAHFDTVASGYNPKSVGPTEKPTERWNVEVGWSIGRPAVADGTVYLSTQTHLHAIDVESGEERWSRGPTDRTDAPGYTAPAVDDGTVYVGVSRGGGLLALDAADGSERWRYETGDERTGVDVPPIPDSVGDGGWSSLVVASDDGVVHHLDLETQEANWTFEVYGHVSRLVSRGNVVHAGTEGGEVYALYDGEGLWRRKLPGKITALGAQHDGGDVLASTFGGGVFRLRDGAHAGRTRWHTEDGPVAHEAFVVADGRVCGTDLADATVLDERSGDVQWEVDGDFGVPPAGAGDTLYLGGEDGIVAYRLDGGFGVDDVRFGGKRWHYPFEGSVGSGVTVADGAVFAVDTGGEDAPSRLVVLE
ncbi:Outer membrane protein assembly factor BamB, contains PQQ-like beta-propeller repeat [Halogranum amylolyticum]|uniref:Outer membrane protein assembly factor BamB, contains PQQ-like beta-propeller repeat n=1 Tax=Halogranum amylolyticum TaxID=660520 RepID=A0A1H8NAD9_9EURY|nr:PQQ-binding-like beta-propeller repeat protein [Halogranum amylolyticum]SEO26393.1 Outer membrane protein assembly factor BamB, contains PQQ-like beta-propeller repeat [Halogranum amylolyticum]